MTSAQRVAKVAAAQQRTNSAARPVDAFLQGSGGSVLPQTGPEFENQVVTEEIPAGSATKSRSAEVGANPMLHNEQRFS